MKACLIIAEQARSHKCNAFITYKLKNSRFADALHFPNRPWLRSFRLAWGLGGNRLRRRDYNKLHEVFKVRLRLFFEDFVKFKGSEFYELK